MLRLIRRVFQKKDERDEQLRRINEATERQLQEVVEAGKRIAAAMDEKAT